MANRVLIDTTGMKVSKPGINVLTAGKSDLLFHSDWTHVSEVVSGTVRVTYGAAKITIPLGITFSSVPYLDVWWFYNGVWVPFWATTNPAALGNSDNVLITTSTIEFLWNSSPQSPNYRDLAYRVWGYPTP